MNDRNIHNNPSGKPYCCNPSCNRDALWRVKWAPFFIGEQEQFENITDSCHEHLLETITIDYVEYKLIPLVETGDKCNA